MKFIVKTSKHNDKTGYPSERRTKNKTHKILIIKSETLRAINLFDINICTYVCTRMYGFANVIGQTNNYIFVHK